jgi:glutamyl-tRNA synthetase
VPWPATRYDADVFAVMAPFVQTRVRTLGEVVEHVDFLFLESPVLDEAAVAKALKGAGRDVLVAAIEAFDAQAAWDAERLRTALEAVGERLGLKMGKATDWPVRVAVTGRLTGPPLFEPLELLGRAETLRRMRALEAASA